MKKYIVVFGLFLLFLVYFANVKNINSSVFRSIGFSYKILVPALFPTLILSGIMSSVVRLYSSFCCSENEPLDKCKILKINIITGMICGFVVGARAICENLAKFKTKSNKISLYIALSSNAGIAFVVGFVGLKIWDDFTLGIYLYFVQILSALIVFLLVKNLLPENEIISFRRLDIDKLGVIEVITNSVSGAYSTMGLICSFNVFATIVTGLLLSYFNASGIFESFVLSFVDFSMGLTSLDNANKLVSLALTGFAIGFGGISVHLQTFAICEGYGLKKLVFFLYKFLQGILCACLSMLYLLLK